MRIWNLAHGKDGWSLHVIESPAWAVALEEYGVPVINFLTGHLFCCHIPERAFEIPLGRAHWVDEYLTNSLGGKMFDLGQWINSLGTFGHTSNEAWIQIHPDIAFQLDPAFFAKVQEMLDDARED